MRRTMLALCLFLITACTKANVHTPEPIAGSDCSTAIPVSSVKEEYAWIKENIPGGRPVRQSLSSCEAEKFPVDILDVQLPNGSTRTIYFNITKVMEGYKEITKKLLGG